MGKKAKTSRKGKKAWRANISTEDIEEYYEKATKDSHSGGNLSSVPSESLFYYDKASKGTAFDYSALRSRSIKNVHFSLVFRLYV